MGLILIFNSPLSATFCTLEICLCKGARRAWSTPEDNLLLLPANGSSGFVLAARGGFITLRLLFAYSNRATNGGRSVELNQAELNPG